MELTYPTNQDETMEMINDLHAFLDKLTEMEEAGEFAEEEGDD